MHLIQCSTKRNYCHFCTRILSVFELLRIDFINVWRTFHINLYYMKCSSCIYKISAWLVKVYLVSKLGLHLKFVCYGSVFAIIGQTKFGWYKFHWLITIWTYMTLFVLPGHDAMVWPIVRIFEENCITSNYCNFYRNLW